MTPALMFCRIPWTKFMLDIKGRVQADVDQTPIRRFFK
jgi:hypothetical protein